jgi:hypothetical protein
VEEKSVNKGKYSVELFKEGAMGAGQEEIVDRHDNLTVARAIYRGRVSQYPGRLVKLRDRARVLARSDQPETMPWRPNKRRSLWPRRRALHDCMEARGSKTQA